MSSTQNIRLAIANMSCGSCVGRVDRALAALPGVSDVAVNLASETVRLTLDSPARLAEVIAALEQAGSSLDDLVRIRVYTTSRRNFERIAPVVAEHTAAARPANTTVLCDLVELAMKVEIEVTARKAATGA